MSDDAKEFLEGCVIKAQETLDADYENEKNVLKFWNFQAAIEKVGKAIREAITNNNGSTQLDVQAYYDSMVSTGILKASRADFTFSQIETIAKSSFPAYIFAIYVCKGRFPEGEEAISRNLHLWNEYDYVCSAYFDPLHQGKFGK
jgi:hypothetical protein